MCLAGASDWPTLGGDFGRTGVNDAEAGTPPLTPAFSLDLFGASSLRPAAVEGGRIFVTYDQYFGPSNPIYAVSSIDGTTLWSHDFGSVFSVGHPTAIGGDVYLGQCNHSGATFLWALDAATGAITWSSPMSSQWEDYWAPVVADGRVFSNGGSYGGLYGFDAVTGQQLWFRSLEQYDDWAAAYSNGTVYSFVEGNLRAHDGATGVVQWTRTVTWHWAGWSMRTSPVVSASTAYVIAPPDLHAIDLGTHAVSWTANGTYSGTPAISAGVVFGTSGGSLRAVDATTGVLLWTFAGDGALSYPPVIAGGHVYVSSDANVYAVDLATQAQVWTRPHGGWLSIGAGKLLISEPTGRLTAFNLTH